MLPGQGNISETWRAKDHKKETNEQGYIYLGTFHSSNTPFISYGANHKKETNEQGYIYLGTFHSSNTPFSECRYNLHSTDDM